MSFNCIDISSDEEVEILVKKNSSKFISSDSDVRPQLSSSSLVEKLKRNSNIEFTIDLEKNTPQEKEKFESNKENGFKSESQLQKLLFNPVPQNSTMVSKGKPLISSEVIIIDNDEKEVEEEPKKEAKNSFVIKEDSKDGNKKNSKDVKSNSSAEKNSSSNLIIENGDKIYVIDDDDDDIPKSNKKITNGFNVGNSSNLHSEGKDPTNKRASNNSSNLKKISLPNSTPVKTLKLPLIPLTPLIKQVSDAVMSDLSLPSHKNASLTKGPYNGEVVMISNEQKEPQKRVLRPRKISDPLEDPLAIKPNAQPSQSSNKVNDLVKNHGRVQNRNPNTSGPSKSKPLLSKPNTSESGLELKSPQDSINKYSIENMFDGLVKLACKIFEDKMLGNRLWRYFRAASEDVLKSEEFLNALKLALKSSEETKTPSFDDKMIISRNLKEVMRILKRQPERINRTLRKLNKMLQLINERIHKLEEMEVTSSSDEESENVYCLLDRHRERAAKIYSKICELEGKAAHAGRATLQKFHFSGSSGHPKIEHALERYFNKTRCFPDFLDVKKLIEVTVEKEKIQISPINIHNIAQSVFLEFGNKLQRMRKCDDYTILVDYLDDGTKDPALDDQDLAKKLQENKRGQKKEEEILAEYTRKQVELKSKGQIKSDEEDVENDNESERSFNEEQDNESKKKSLCFSDTEDELINGEIDKEERKRKRSETENSSQAYKKITIDLNNMEVSLKLAASAQNNEPNTSLMSGSTEKDTMMDQLGLVLRGKEGSI